MNYAEETKMKATLFKKSSKILNELFTNTNIREKYSKMLNMTHQLNFKKDKNKMNSFHSPKFAIDKDSHNFTREAISKVIESFYSIKSGRSKSSQKTLVQKNYLTKLKGNIFKGINARSKKDNHYQRGFENKFNYYNNEWQHEVVNELNEEIDNNKKTLNLNFKKLSMSSNASNSNRIKKQKLGKSVGCKNWTNRTYFNSERKERMEANMFKKRILFNQKIEQYLFNSLSDEEKLISSKLFHISSPCKIKHRIWSSNFDNLGIMFKEYDHPKNLTKKERKLQVIYKNYRRREELNTQRYYSQHPVINNAG